MGVAVYDVMVGNEKFLMEAGIHVGKEVKDIARTHEEKGRTVTYIGINGKLDIWFLDIRYE